MTCSTGPAGMTTTAPASCETCLQHIQANSVTPATCHVCQGVTTRAEEVTWSPGDLLTRSRHSETRHDNVGDCHSDSDHEISPLLPSDRFYPINNNILPCYYCCKICHQNCKERYFFSESNSSEILQQPVSWLQSRDQTQCSILEEVLSWRRTRYHLLYLPKVLHSYKKRLKPLSSFLKSFAPNCLSLPFLLLFLSLVPTLVTASESPDRECCDGPVFKPDPGQGQHNYPSYNYPPPEVPDFPEYGPHEVPPRVPGYKPGNMVTSDQCKRVL